MSDSPKGNGKSTIERLPETAVPQVGNIIVTILPDGNIAGFRVEAPFPISPTAMVGALELAKAGFIQQSLQTQTRPALAIPGGIMPNLRGGN